MRKLRNISILALVIVVSTAALAVALVYYAIRRPLPKQEGELVVVGMQDAITIYRDSWGVPHAYAANPYDLFFAQGYVHAQDRWWQMDLSRRLGRGTLSALLGENDAIQATDRLARTLGWEQLAQAGYAVSTFETRAVLHAYSAGVNAYIEGRSPGDLAVEYTLLGLRVNDIPIEPWTPLDSLAWLMALQWQNSGNVAQEIANALALARVDDAMLALYTPRPPLDAATILSAADLDLPETPSPADAAVPPPAALPDYTRLPLAEVLAGLDLVGPREMPEGTAWVVAGSQTASGSPLLAVAPGSPLQIPSPFYEVGLYCIETPELCPYNLAGLSVPGIPGVFSGHNGRVAWALNAAWIDEQDLFVVRLNPANPLQYAWGGGWRDLIAREELLIINGVEEPQPFTVYSTHLGPVIATTSPLLGRDQALVVRWTAQDGPADPLIALFKLNRAASWDEARAALSLWALAAQNVLYADTSGTIGYQLAGRVPVRAPGHSGLLPVACESSAGEWRGLLPFDLLPTVTNPAGGMIVAANNPSVPPAYSNLLAAPLDGLQGVDLYSVLTSTAAPGYRAAQIAARLREHNAHTPDTFAAIQADVFSPTAAAALPIVVASQPADDELGEMLAWLSAWDARFTQDSPQAALFGAFWLRLAEYTYGDELGAPPCDCLAVRQGLLALLDSPNHPWWDDVQTRFVIERRDAIVRRALAQAIIDLTQAQGANRDAWQWGDLHRATFSGSSGAGLFEDQLTVGPLPVGGTGDSVNTTRSAGRGRDRWDVVHAPAARLIIDLANPESSRAILSTGQSNHLASAHYRDMVDPWRFVKYHTLLWERSSIEEASEAMLALEPVYIPLSTPVPPPES